MKTERINKHKKNSRTTPYSTPGALQIEFSVIKINQHLLKIICNTLHHCLLYIHQCVHGSKFGCNEKQFTKFKKLCCICFGLVPVNRIKSFNASKTCIILYTFKSKNMLIPEFKCPTGVYYWNESETNLEMLPKIPTYVCYSQNILLSIFGAI